MLRYLLSIPPFGIPEATCLNLREEQLSISLDSLPSSRTATRSITLGDTEERGLSDVFHNDAMTFEQRRDVIVARIKVAPWHQKALNDEDDGFDLTDAVTDLAESESPNAFDEAWDRIYDWCDTDHRVWIDT